MHTKSNAAVLDSVGEALRVLSGPKPMSRERLLQCAKHSDEQVQLRTMHRLQRMRRMPPDVVRTMTEAAITAAKRRRTRWTPLLDGIAQAIDATPASERLAHRASQSMLAEQLQRLRPRLQSDRSGRVATALIASHHSPSLLREVASHSAGLRRKHLTIILERTILLEREMPHADVDLEGQLLSNKGLPAVLAQRLAKHLVERFESRRRLQAHAVARVVTQLWELQERGATRLSFPRAVRFAVRVLRLDARGLIPTGFLPPATDLAAAMIFDCGAGQASRHPTRFAEAMRLSCPTIRSAVLLVV